MRQRTGPVGRMGDSPFRTGPPSIPNPLLKLIPKPPSAPSVGLGSLIRFAWATVTSAFPDPVQVQVDTETDPLPGVPSMLCTVDLGDRVFLVQFGRRVVVLGVAQPDQSQGFTNASGTVSITPTAINTVATAHVTFDTAFNQTPAITVTAYTAVPQYVFTSYRNPAPDGFDIYLVRSDTAGATTVSWIAQV